LADSVKEKYENLKTIYNDYLLKDLSLFLSSGDILNLKKFLKILASKVGSQINISKICEEAGLSRYIVEKYLFALENFFIFESVYPWTKGRYKNEIKKKEKIYFVDVGILRYLL
jgi:predicted AAA+ superfamily ATPase